MLPATSSCDKMWSKRGGAKPTMLIGLGAGSNGTGARAICIPYTSSMTCPLGNVTDRFAVTRTDLTSL